MAAEFIKRRNFLRGLAGATIGLPLLESVTAGPLQAQDAEPTKRFLSFHCSSGVNTDRFWPALGALGSGSFTGRGTEALSRYADRILIPRGVHGYPVGTWTGHSEGTCQALTAAAHVDTNAQSASIDQVIASALNPPGRDALVVRPGGRDLGVAGFNSISYRASGERVDAESNPYLAYRAMMGLGQPAPTGDDEANNRLLRKRQSIVDFARTEVDELRRANLSASDKMKLDQHFSLIRDVEVGMTNDPAIQACVLEAPTLAELEAINADTVESNENFPHMARHFVRVVALSLACQYTRSAVLQWGAAVAGSPMYQWDGISHNYRHHPISHGTTEDFSGDEVSGWQDMLHEIDRWNVAEFASLLDLLDSYDEGGGRTLLDNSVVLYTNEFSHGQGHTTGDLPIIIAGGAGYFRLGQSLVISGSSADIGGVNGAAGHSHKMLCTVLNAVGVVTPEWNGGAELQELKA